MKSTVSLKALLQECRAYVASEPMGESDRNLLARIDRALAAPHKANGQDKPRLNIFGKPYSAGFDPKYKRKTPLTSIGRLSGPASLPMLSPDRWADQCENAAYHWKRAVEEGIPLPTSHAEYVYPRKEGA